MIESVDMFCVLPSLPDGPGAQSLLKCIRAMVRCLPVLVCFSYRQFLTSFSVVPAGRSAAATTIYISVIRRLPVAPLGRKLGRIPVFVGP